MQACMTRPTAIARSVSPAAPRLDLSIVIPVYNEEDNLRELHTELEATLKPLSIGYEIIFVDDGSKDGSRDILRELVEKNSAVRAILFRRNFGQTAAMA